MAIKFFNVLKANAEIERLETDLAALTETNKTLSEQNATLTTAGESVTALTAANTKLTTELAASQASIAELTTEHATQLSAATSDFEVKVKEAGGKEASRIMAKAGQPPLKQELNAPNEPDKKNVLEQWQAAKGVEKTRLWTKHEAEILQLREALKKK